MRPVHNNLVLVPQDIKDSVTAILGTDKWYVSKGSDAFTDKIGGNIYFVVLGDSEVVVARWELVQMVHCCGICVSTSAQVDKNYSGKGLGTVLNQFRIHLARQLGYGCLMCTDIESNVAQRKILEKNGWKDVHSFVNPRTSNRVFISVIDLGSS